MTQEQLKKISELTELERCEFFRIISEKTTKYLISKNPEFKKHTDDPFRFLGNYVGNRKKEKEENFNKFEEFDKFKARFPNYLLVRDGDKAGIDIFRASLQLTDDIELLKYISNGFDVKSTYEDQENLLTAWDEGFYNFDVIKWAIEDLGMDINFQNREGNTVLILSLYPIICSSHKYNCGIIDYLLEKGANKNLKNKEGKTFGDIIGETLEFIYDQDYRIPLETLKCLSKHWDVSKYYDLNLDCEIYDNVY